MWSITSPLGSYLRDDTSAYFRSELELGMTSTQAINLLRLTNESFSSSPISFILSSLALSEFSRLLIYLVLVHLYSKLCELRHPYRPLYLTSPEVP